MCRLSKTKLSKFGKKIPDSISVRLVLSHKEIDVNDTLDPGQL